MIFFYFPKNKMQRSITKMKEAAICAVKCKTGLTIRFITILLTVSFLLGTTSCGKSPADTSGDVHRKDAAVIKQENQAADSTKGQDETMSENHEDDIIKKTEYPLTIVTYDYAGNEVETVYEKAPEKVLAVYQGCVETMLALGLEDHLIAAAGLDNEVPDEQKPAFSGITYLDEFTPSLETVTMLEPDMIFSWSSLFGESALGDVRGWIEKGCNTYYSTNTRQGHNRTLQNEYADILNIGKIFDVQDKAEAMVDNIQTMIEKTTKAAVEAGEKQSVLILEPLGSDITNYGAASLGGDMVTKLGAELANPDAKTIGKEDIISVNPEVIFVVYMPYAGDDPEEVKESQLSVIRDDKSLQSLDVVKNGRIYPVMLSEMYASATRTQDGIQTFASGLYPDLGL